MMEYTDTGATEFSVFDEARALGEHTDVIIRANDSEFKAHKIILCGCSSYFRALFSNNWNSTEKPFYEIPGISSDIMSLIIQCAYKRPVPITEDNVQELLVAADQLLVSHLVEACCQFLEARLDPENCVDIYRFTEHFYSCSQLHHKAKLYILRHFEEVLHVSKEFLELSLEQFEEIIAQDELNVRQEEEVFKAVLRWIDHDPQNRRKHIAVLLPKVRLGLMPSQYFTDNVQCNALVMENEACKPVIINAMSIFTEVDEPTSSELIHQLTRPRLPFAILFAIGGWSNSIPTNRIDAYDARTDRWVRVTQAHGRPRVNLGTVVLHEFFYCIGGKYNELFHSIQPEEIFHSVMKFNLITKTWHVVPSMYERRCCVSVAVLDGLIYAIGGYDGNQHLRTAERYDPNTNQWTMLPPMNEVRCDASATSLQSRVYVCGGWSRAECHFSAESFNPETNQWTLIAPMSSRRSGVGVITYGDLVYAVGGFDGVTFLESVEAYNPLTDQWHDVESMTNACSNFGIGVVDDQLFVVGGRSRWDRWCSDVKYYDQRTNQWNTARGMNIPRNGLSCCVISGSPYVTQYGANRNSPQTSEDESDSD